MGKDIVVRAEVGAEHEVVGGPAIRRFALLGGCGGHGVAPIEGKAATIVVRPFAGQGWRLSGKEIRVHPCRSHARSGSAPATGASRRVPEHGRPKQDAVGLMRICVTRPSVA